MGARGGGGGQMHEGYVRGARGVHGILNHGEGNNAGDPHRTPPSESQEACKAISQPKAMTWYHQRQM